MHFALDGLTSLVVTLQPVLADRISARPAMLGLIVATALATASLLQPLAARLVHRRGERAVAATGAALAAVGYGSIPASTNVPVAVAAVLVGGLGSALFHPAAGALVARASGGGRDALPLAAFSAVGTAGTALVPLGVLTSVETLGWAAAVPVSAVLIALTAATRAGLFRPVPRSDTASGTAQRGRRHIRLAILAAALIALSSVTVGASAAVLVAQVFGSSHPAVAWVVAAYSAAGAVGGLALAVWARRADVRTVLIAAVAAGTTAAAAVPFLPGAWIFAAVMVAGAGLSGSLPLLVGHARRAGESSAAGAVGRVLGLGAGLGGAGYAAVGLAQTAFGYASALTGTAALAGTVALAAGWFLCRSVDPTECHDVLSSAATACPCGTCACA
jgi:FSR family fosmidomycin resistance protein-like MFS transporter